MKTYIVTIKQHVGSCLNQNIILVATEKITDILQNLTYDEYLNSNTKLVIEIEVA